MPRWPWPDGVPAERESPASGASRVLVYLPRHWTISRPNGLLMMTVTELPMTRDLRALVHHRRADGLCEPLGCEFRDHGRARHRLYRSIPADEALDRYDHREIFSTDQGAKFANGALARLLREQAARVTEKEHGYLCDIIFAE